MSGTIINTRRALAACAIAGFATVNASILMPQDAAPLSDSTETRDPQPPLLAPPDTNAAEASPDIDLPAGKFELLEGGYRRVHRTETQTLTPEQIAEMLAASKGDQVKGDQLTVDTFTDYLPANWMPSVAGVPAGARVDSLGNPIVNDAFALPGWAQQDVDALRDEIGDWLLHLDNLDLAIEGHAARIARIPPRATIASYVHDPAALRAQARETEMVLGNYIGQAIARGIEFRDFLPLDHPRMTASAIDSIALFLHYYENLKADESRRTGQPGPRGAYPADIVALLQRHAHDISDVLSIDQVQDEGAVAGFNCYERTAFTLGEAFTVGAIGIWHGSANPADDHQADIPIGYSHHLHIPSQFSCDTHTTSTMVRVGSNGYVTFYQAGGGSTLGTSFNNTTLPSTIDPDFFAAPRWDDLHVINQGVVDEVVYKLEGAVGDRVCIVEYWSVSTFSGSSNEFYYFQVKLFESDLRIELHYSPGATDPGFEHYSVGFEDRDGLTAECGPNCGNLNTGSTPPNNYRYTLPHPSTDNCATPLCVAHGVLTGQTTFRATGVDVTSCALGDFADLWYRFTAALTGNVTVNTCSAGFNTTLAVFTACGGTQVACNDDFCGPRSSLTFPAVDGMTYLIRVAGFDGARGQFSLALDTGVAGETIDQCSPMGGVSFSASGTTENNTGCNTECGSDTIDEWLCWTAPVSNITTITTCNTGTNFNTTLTLYRRESVNSFERLLCNNDAVGGNCAGGRSRITFNAQAGADYRIRIAGSLNTSGQYRLDLAPSNCPADVSPLSGDRVVDIDDLLTLISDWGSCPVPYCRSDLAPPGGDNVVGIDDLLAVIAGWGACPP